MATDFDIKVFGNKKYSDLLKEIYERTKNKETQINSMISQLRDLIQPGNVNDGLIVTPLVHSYVESGIKNDKLLIDMVGIIQKGLDRGKDTGDTSMTDLERDQLLKLSEQLSAENAAITGKAIGVA